MYNIKSKKSFNITGRGMAYIIEGQNVKLKDLNIGDTIILDDKEVVIYGLEGFRRDSDLFSILIKS